MYLDAEMFVTGIYAIEAITVRRISIDTSYKLCTQNIKKDMQKCNYVTYFLFAPDIFSPLPIAVDSSRC